jgi:hypothetical protein
LSKPGSHQWMMMKFGVYSIDIGPLPIKTTMKPRVGHPEDGVQMKTSMPKGADPASVIDYLIVGGGLAGATAADTLRREGAAGSIAILSAEDMAPYHRPRLSKSYLLGASSADEMLVHPVDFYAAQKIDLRLSVRVARVDTQQRQAHTTDGEVVRYGQMLLAPGATPRRSSAEASTPAPPLRELQGR